MAKDKAKKDIIKKLMGVLDKMKDRKPRLIRLTAMLKKLKHQKELKERPYRKHKYTGGIYKLAQLIKSARMDPGYRITKNPNDTKRLRRLWDAQVVGPRS